MISRSTRATSAALGLLLVSASGASAKAPAGRYQVNKAADTTLDTKTNLTWRRTHPPLDDTGKKTWEDAIAYCTAQGSGWRLPSVRELQSLLDYAAKDALWDHDAFAFEDERWPIFWSFTEVKTTSTPYTYAFAVSFSSGHTHSYVKTSPGAVLCVRSDP